MKFIQWITLASIHHCILANSSKSWSVLLIQKIAQELHPYQVKVITNNKLIKNDLTSQNTFNLMPKTLINLFGVSEIRENQVTDLKYPVRDLDLYLILDDEIDPQKLLKRISHILNVLIQLRPLSPRSKCLLLLHNNYKLSDIFLNKLFVYAWSLQFLDFSILNIDKGNALFVTYNPFLSQLEVEKFRWNTNIFPDKLNNMYKFSYQIPFIEWKPSVTLMNHTITNDTRNIVGNHYAFIEFFSEVTNCTLNLIYSLDIQTKPIPVAKLLKKMFKQMKNNEVNMDILLMPVGLLLYNKSVVIGNMCFDDKLIIIVPVIIVDIASKLLLYLLLMSALAALLYFMSSILQCSAVNWNCLSIFQIFIGMPIPCNLKSLKQRIYFIVITVFSMKFSSMIFTEFTQTNILTKEIEFNNFEDIPKFGLTLYVPAYYESHMRKHENQAVRNVMQHAKIVKNTRDCIDELVKYRNRACVLSKYISEYLIEKHRNDEGTSNIRLSELILSSDKLAFAFEQASPYVHKFNNIFRRIIESGMPSSAIPKWNNIRIHSHLKFNSIDKPTGEKIRDFDKVVYILYGGYCISLISFVMEMCISIVKIIYNNYRIRKIINWKCNDKTGKMY